MISRDLFPPSLNTLCVQSEKLRKISNSQRKPITSCCFDSLDASDELRPESNLWRRFVRFAPALVARCLCVNVFVYNFWCSRNKRESCAAERATYHLHDSVLLTNHPVRRHRVDAKFDIVLFSSFTTAPNFMAPENIRRLRRISKCQPSLDIVAMPTLVGWRDFNELQSDIES